MKRKNHQYIFQIGNLRETLNQIDLQLLDTRPVPNALYGANLQDKFNLIECSSSNPIQIDLPCSSRSNTLSETETEKDRKIQDCLQTRVKSFL